MLIEVDAWLINIDSITRGVEFVYKPPLQTLGTSHEHDLVVHKGLQRPLHPELNNADCLMDRPTSGGLSIASRIPLPRRTRSGEKNENENQTKG